MTFLWMASIRPGAFLGASGSSLSFQGLAFLFGFSSVLPPPRPCGFACYPALMLCCLLSALTRCCCSTRLGCLCRRRAPTSSWVGGRYECRCACRRRLVVGEGVLLLGSIKWAIWLVSPVRERALAAAARGHWLSPGCALPSLRSAAMAASRRFTFSCSFSAATAKPPAWAFRWLEMR